MVASRAIKGVYIVAAKRTPFGSYGGKLMNFSATDLQEVAAKAALASGNIRPEIISSTVIGNVFHEINVGDSEVVLTGGAENMSLSPHAVRGIRFGVRLGQDVIMEDSLWAGLTDFQIKTPMGVTAENLAEKFGITREQCDAYAVRSQQRWKKAHDAGHFKDELAPVEVKTKKGVELVDTDEHPKPATTIESLSKLPTVFKKNGTVNAGNASGICDGAGCIILASEEACTKHNLKPLARVVGYGIAGCDPHIMGIGPVTAIEALLQATNKSVGDIDLVDVNEAFAPQFLAVEKSLELDPEKTNVNGGAIALGHPVGASGSRITANLIYELRRRRAKYGIGAACIGGGQGIAVMIESIL